MSDIAIQIDHVWKKFRKGEVHDSLRELIPALFRRLRGRTAHQQNLKQSEFWALKDVSFEVKKGESLGIIGPNGAGKSTMLKVLSRILKPNRGSYNVQGRITSLIEVGAGFHPDLTGRENIYLNGTILGMTRKEIKAKEEAIIDFSGIEGFIDTPVKRYSSGMGARLGFAVAAHLQTDVLLVDEVLSVGDARFRHKCARHMKTMLRSGITVVFISHILDQVRSLCSRTLVLDKGSVTFNGDTDGAIRHYLDLLALGDSAVNPATGVQPVEVRDVRLCDAEGNEVIEWHVGEPGSLVFELVVRQARMAEQIAVNVNTVGGVYVGCIHSSKSHGPIATAPGVYQVRLDVSPMPLSDGDFAFELQVFGYDENSTYKTTWQSPQSRVVTVRGSEVTGQIVQFNGHWQVEPVPQAGSQVDRDLSARRALPSDAA